MKTTKQQAHIPSGLLLATQPDTRQLEIALKTTEKALAWALREIDAGTPGARSAAGELQKDVARLRRQLTEASMTEAKQLMTEAAQAAMRQDPEAKELTERALAALAVARHEANS